MLWWGTEAQAQRKDIASLVKKLEERKEKLLEGDDAWEMVTHHKLAQMMLQAIDMVTESGTDTLKFKQTYDEIETRMLLEPAVDFPWPHHLKAARERSDLRECTGPPCS